jgi:bacterioferritin (cytochrome b1)
MDRPVQCADLQTVPDGYVAKSQQNLSDCPVTYQPVQVHLATDGTVNEKPVGEQVVTSACAGRRPDGLSLVGARAGGPGACLAELAELELASIAAFAELARQLTAHGAPTELVQRCHDARSDEIEHARVVGALAQRFGAQPQLVRVAASGPRALFELALENAREGCVRELYGAAAATWQAERAQDEGVRKAFARIARDESEHAALALDLDAWFRAQLSAAQCAQLEAEKQRAYAELGAQLGQTPDSEAQRVAGLPNAARAAALLAGVRGLARVA